MAIAYDRKIIDRFAERLYASAASITFGYAIVFAGVGSYIGGFIDEQVLPIILGGISGSIGLLIGLEKSFTLKLQAQTALCQAQIEDNLKIIAAYLGDRGGLDKFIDDVRDDEIEISGKIIR